ncbi:MAG: hypothetical protein ACRCW9_03845 [Cetobacterium sp.]
MAKIIGDFPNRPTDWLNGEEVNGNVMNEIDRALYLLDQAELNDRSVNISPNMLKWWARNQANWYKGEALTGDTNTSISVDTTNNRLYNSSSRITVTSSTGDVFCKGYINKSINGNYFESGDPVDTSLDWVTFSIYVSDSTKVKTNSFILWIGTPGGGFYKGLTLSTGWNSFVIRLNEFTNSGSPVWSSITYIELQWRTPVGVSGLNSYISFQYLGLTRGQSGSANYNITWENNGENVYTPELYEAGADCSIIEDFLSEPVFYFVKPSSLLRHNAKWRTFYTKATMICKKYGVVAGLRWRLDSNNYVSVYIYNNNLYMRVIASGVEVLSESNSNVLPFLCEVNDQVEFRFKKVGGYFECGVIQRGSYQEEFVLCGYNTFANNEGYVEWGSFSPVDEFTGLYKWEVSNNKKTIENVTMKLRNDYIKLIRTTDQLVTTSSDTYIQWNSRDIIGGNCFAFDTTSDAGIKILKGVKTIQIDVLVWAEAIATNSYSWLRVRKNSTEVISSIIAPSAIQSWRCHAGSTIINVSDGDFIRVVIAFNVAGGSNVVKGNNSYAGGCQLIAKVLEYD